MKPGQDVRDDARDDVRFRLALALDTDDLDRAVEMALATKEVFGVVKVGLELFSACGPAAVTRLISEGFQVFVDLKLYDIPTTVEKAARVLGRSGCSYTTVHGAGGMSTLEAAVAGCRQGAYESGHPVTNVLAVTVLTSEIAQAGEIFRRTELAAQSGCAGIVCSTDDVYALKQRHPELIAVVPGIRLPGDPRHDQVRASTPAQAIEKGADLLVVGRAVTASRDPLATAFSIREDVMRLIFTE
ncbi:MAG: orotidine-5'-phosphate decarboxylase [Actinobacteria bacterium]|nr:orotidine-5'-phosphate decarboxylase [Actinomycetota bacterium]